MFTLPFPFRRTAHLAATLAIAAGLSLPWATWAAGAEAPAAATAAQDLFVQISAANLEGVSRYLRPEGFSEFAPEWAGLKQLDAKAFEGLFKSGTKLDLRLIDLKTQDLGDTALVTGTRVGTITPPQGAAIDTHLAFTMVWTKVAGGWKPAHVHLAPVGGTAAK